MIRKSDNKKNGIYEIVLSRKNTAKDEDKRVTKLTVNTKNKTFTYESKIIKKEFKIQNHSFIGILSSADTLKKCVDDRTTIYFYCHEYPSYSRFRRKSTDIPMSYEIIVPFSNTHETVFTIYTQPKSQIVHESEFVEICDGRVSENEFKLSPSGTTNKNDLATFMCAIHRMNNTVNKRGVV